MRVTHSDDFKLSHYHWACLASTFQRLKHYSCKLARPHQPGIVLPIDGQHNIS
jgi:hypothetical protein